MTFYSEEKTELFHTKNFKPRLKRLLEDNIYY